MPKNTARKVTGWRQAPRPKSATPTPRNPAALPAQLTPTPETPAVVAERSVKERWEGEGGKLAATVKAQP